MSAGLYMKLKTRLFIILAVFFAVSSLVNILMQQAFVLPAFYALEQKEAENNLRRIQEAVHREARFMENYTKDWAYWDDTYQFCRDGNPSYRKSNLTDETFYTADINLIIILNRNRRLLYQRIIDLEEEKPLESPLDGIPSDPWPANHPLLACMQKKTPQPVTGLLPTGRGRLIVSPAPVLQSSGTVPSAGTLIMGRFLTPARVNQLSEQIKVNFTLHPLDENELSGGIIRAAEAFRAGAASYQEPEAPGKLSLFTSFENLRGKPYLIGRTLLPREITQRGMTAVSTALGFFALSHLIFLAAVLLLIQHLVIKPIRLMEDHVDRLINSRDYSRRITLDSRGGVVPALPGVQPADRDSGDPEPGTGEALRE